MCRLLDLILHCCIGPLRQERGRGVDARAAVDLEVRIMTGDMNQHLYIYCIHVHNNKSRRLCNDACMCVSVSHLYTYKYFHQYNTAVDVSQGCMRGDGRGVRIMRDGMKTGRLYWNELFYIFYSC